MKQTNTAANTSSAKWNQPQVMSDLDCAFPGSVSHLMPAYASITKQIPDKWRQFQSDWFFAGITTQGLVAKPGVDKRAALRHLGAINGSFEPNHEHKEAAVAYLASLWFEDASTWTRVK